MSSKSSHILSINILCLRVWLAHCSFRILCFEELLVPFFWWPLSTDAFELMGLLRVQGRYMRGNGAGFFGHIVLKCALRGPKILKKAFKELLSTFFVIFRFKYLRIVTLQKFFSKFLTPLVIQSTVLFRPAHFHH